MPICIYCCQQKARAEFPAEHVLTRAFCGQGNNWTLKDMVCLDCNGALSKFESHWANSAVESIMRNFSGPRGRVGNVGARAQPVEIDEFYAVQIDDPLVYEAGFAFPNDLYFRPQIVVSPAGLVSIAANAVDGAALETALANNVRKPPFEITDRDPQRSEYSIATVGINPSTQRFYLKAVRNAKASAGIWLRRLDDGAMFRDMNGKDRVITPRLALDDRGRLYMRAKDLQAAAEFFDKFLQPPAPPQPTRNYRPGEQTFRPRVKTQLPLVFRCVLKTGLNLVAHVGGSQLALDRTFDELRAELFDTSVDAAIMRRCRFIRRLPAWLGWLPSSFPLPPETSQHRMMLDTHCGKIRFRLRLYGTLGYVAYLGRRNTTTSDRLPTTRVMVDFQTTGMRQVDHW
jgi:hypothetical protein